MLNHESDWNGYAYFDTAFGSPAYRNHVARIDQLEIPPGTSDCFTTMFRFGEEYATLCAETGSVKNASSLPCYSDFLWFDLDNRDPGQALQWCKQLVGQLEGHGRGITEHLAIYFSGCKGFHLGLPTRLFDLRPSVDLPLRIRRIAEELAGDIAIDTSIYEHNRLWRIPNTRHSKSGLYKTKLAPGELTTWSIDQIREKAKQSQGAPYVAFPGSDDLRPHPVLLEIAESVDLAATRFPKPDGNRVVKNGPGWISNALDHLHESNRNSTFAKVAGRLHNDGWDPQDIEALLVPHATRVDFPLDELRDEVEGICDRYEPATRFPISDPIYKRNREIESVKPISLDNLLRSKSDKPKWLVDRVFPAEGVGILGGRSGIGKSWILLDLALACASEAEDWLGHRIVRPGPVLYVDEESWQFGLKERCELLLRSRSKPQVHGIEFLIGQNISFSNASAVNQLSRIIGDVRPCLVILDSLVRLHDAEENSASEMARMFSIVKALVREHHCLFLFADHHGKPKQFNTGLQNALRGSSEKVAFVDTLLSVTSKKDLLTIHHTKSRFGEPVPAFSFRLRSLISGELEIERTAVIPDSVSSPRLQDAIQTIKANLSASDSISRPDLITIGREQGLSEKTVDGALKYLIEEQVILPGMRKLVEGRGGKTKFYRLSDKNSTATTGLRERSC